MVLDIIKRSRRCCLLVIGPSIFVVLHKRRQHLSSRPGVREVSEIPSTEGTEKIERNQRPLRPVENRTSLSEVRDRDGSVPEEGTHTTRHPATSTPLSPPKTQI